MKESKILIDYPAQFACGEKLTRKLDRILSRLPQCTICYVQDETGLIHRWLTQNPGIFAERIAAEAVNTASITHSIIFEAESRTAQFRSLENVTTRIIPVSITTVVNKDRGDPFDVYIGRGTKWGNPYAVGFGQAPGEKSDSREEAIRKYAYDFDRGLLGTSTFMEELNALRGKRLGCHCKPHVCHGDVLAHYLNTLDDGM